MKNGKYCNGKKRMNMKPLAVLLALMLLVGCAVGGTLAWLTAKTPEVKNTFSASTIGVELEETERTYKMVPGWTIDKDPKAWITEGSEDAYLFVQVQKSANFDNFMTYAIADGWTELPGTPGVYYREVETAEMGTEFPILKDDKVSVKDTVTEAMMEGLTDATKPTLTFNAYAVQLWKSNKPADLTDEDAVAAAKFTPAEAWAECPKGNS